MFFTQNFSKKRDYFPYLNSLPEKFVLTKDTWNDYGYETTFWLDYWRGNQFKEIGLIRILNVDSNITRDVIPDKFNELSDKFISLGYNEEFYTNLIKLLGKKSAEEILIKLNDISIVGLEKNNYFSIDHPGIQESFFRSSEGRFLYEEVKNTFFLNKDGKDRDYKFTFMLKNSIPLNDEIVDIEIDFKSQSEYLPNRIFTIVGKNGVGKTRFLNQLAESLYDSSKPENKNRFILKNNHDGEIGNVPIYNKVIAISFSVFDKFYKGSISKLEYKSNIDEFEILTKDSNYTYIGLHKINGNVFNFSEIIKINKRAFKKIIEKDRKDFLIGLINESNILHYDLKSSSMDEKFFDSPFSSGQSVFISMICRLISEIEEGSLIFLDEPELYLHPNAISNLARVYYLILEKFKSYAILCTHSPILVQEIPSKYVRKMSLVDNQLIYNRPSIETFGENISEIIAEIFNVLDYESLYKSNLKKLVTEMKFSEDQILELFENKLNFKTQLYISSLFNEEELN